MGLFGIFKKKKTELTENQRKWNKMWTLWVEEKADSPYAELMKYHSEINNGGHGQYFTNVENNGDLQEEMSALAQILSAKLNANLQQAYAAYLVLEEREDQKAEETLEQCDDVFYENEKEIIFALEEYASKIQL